MIRVTAAPDGDNWSTYEHPDGKGWSNDERGNLDILAHDVAIASYRDGTWFRVWEEQPAEGPAQDPYENGDPPTPSIGSPDRQW